MNSDHNRVNEPELVPDGSRGDQSPFETAVREELGYLRDLFERRLLNEKVARHAIDVLQDQLRFANRSLQEELLLPIVHEVLAVCDRLRRGSDLSDSLMVTIDELLEVFYRRGLREVEWQGRFDSRFHESVAFVDGRDEFTELTSIELERPGYWLGDRLVRPARVTVAGPSQEEQRDASHVRHGAMLGNGEENEEDIATDE